MNSEDTVQPEKNPRLLYSPATAAQVLDVSRSKIYEMMRAGALGYVLIGADRRIPAAEVERVAAEGAPGKVAA